MVDAIGTGAQAAAPTATRANVFAQVGGPTAPGQLIADSSSAAPPRRDDVEGAVIAEGPNAGFLSPIIRVDPSTQLAILQFRDSQTGTIETQYPSEQTVRAYRAGSETQPNPFNRSADVQAVRSSVAEQSVVDQPTRVTTGVNAPAPSEAAEGSTLAFETVAPPRSTTEDV